MDAQLNDRITALISFGFSKALIAKIARVSVRQMHGHGTPEWQIGKRTQERLLAAVERLEWAVEGRQPNEHHAKAGAGKKTRSRPATR